MLRAFAVHRLVYHTMMCQCCKCVMKKEGWEAPFLTGWGSGSPSSRPIFLAAPTRRIEIYRHAYTKDAYHYQMTRGAHRREAVQQPGREGRPTKSEPATSKLCVPSCLVAVVCVTRIHIYRFRFDGRGCQRKRSGNSVCDWATRA